MDHWCNVQLEIIFSKPANRERVKTNWQVAGNRPLYDSHGRPYKRTAFLFQW